MRLRPAEDADLPALADILNAEIRSGTASWTETQRSSDAMRRWHAERRGAGHPVLVAEEGGRILGYASYGPFRRGEGYRLTVEHSVYVARDARRRGVARALMTVLIAEARAAGLHRMIGGVSADQEASMALHRALGFVEAGRLTEVGRKRGRWLDLALMELDLGGGGPGR
ncbi:MAG TPA: GNAT family N-acetyltransferase [Thermohalobaculum sp.]|nr:GNAT family N-acetyltransferase [Thermohalobaculum sp.]